MLAFWFAQIWQGVTSDGGLTGFAAAEASFVAKRAIPGPASIIFVFDHSSSMDDDTDYGTDRITKLEALRRVAESVVGGLHED